MALRIIAERELQKTHARQTELLPQFLHRRSDHAQVLRHNRQFAKCVLQRRQKSSPGPLTQRP
jgi:hypothetical protein